MNERETNDSNRDATDFRYWERLVEEYPRAGDVVQYDAASPFEELRRHNTILHLVVLGFYSIADEARVVSLLLDRGADANNQNDNGETPLHIVCQATMRDPEIARLLLKHGADPTVPTTDGKRPIDFLGEHDRYSRELHAILEEAVA